MDKFILLLPEWGGKTAFSSEVINLILVSIALVAGVLLCFWGYRYFQTIALVLLGCGCGFLGYRISEKMTQRPVLQMFFWVMFMFLGVCLFYFLSIVLVHITKKMDVYASLQRKLHYIAAVVGALFVGILTYTQVFHNLIAVICIAVLLAVIGMWYGSRKAKDMKVFYTYDDLLKLKPLTEENGDA